MNKYFALTSLLFLIQFHTQSMDMNNSVPSEFIPSDEVIKINRINISPITKWGTSTRYENVLIPIMIQKITNQRFVCLKDIHNAIKTDLDSYLQEFSKKQYPSRIAEVKHNGKKMDACFPLDDLKSSRVSYSTLSNFELLILTDILVLDITLERQGQRD